MAIKAEIIYRGRVRCVAAGSSAELIGKILKAIEDLTGEKPGVILDLIQENKGFEANTAS